MLESWTRRRGLRLAEGQRLALLLALRKPFAIVTGGPGVGKTTILAALCDLAAVDDQQVALAAPTGRAAKRMSEATGRPATTLHRLLEFQPGTGRFARNEQAPLEVDLVVVDECSMLDLPLAYQVLRAVGPATRLVFVGDVDQLPSVGPGRILADLVDSGLVPVARLDEVFRQGEGSRIVANAHRVRRGEMPLFPRDEGGEDPDRDCFFVETRDPGRALELATRIVCERIPRAYGLDPIEDVQVLAPMYRGPLGVDALNRALGDRLVPGGRELERGGHRYRVGDKVLAVQNDYELELFNGDPGRLLALDDEAGRARFRFGGRELELPYDELGRVVPAYAITVHRAQGSEYPAVVLALDRGHYMLLYRRLLYTAMTRASRLLVLVGSRWALERAVGNDREGDRCTGLGLRLRHRAVGDGVHPEATYPPRDPQA